MADIASVDKFLNHYLVIFILIIRGILSQNNDNVYIHYMYMLEMIILFISMFYIWWSPHDQIKIRISQLCWLLLAICIIDGILLINNFTFINIAYFIQTINICVFIASVEINLYHIFIITGLFYYVFIIMHMIIKDSDLDLFILCLTLIVCTVSSFSMDKYYIQKNLLNNNSIQ